MKGTDVAAIVNKTFGEGTLMKASDPSLQIEVIPTEILPFDLLLGGGIPKGRSTEIFGDFSSLKSYIGLHAISQAQGDGGKCALIDTEHAFDPEWAAEQGVDLDTLALQQPTTGELAVDTTEVLIRSGYDLIVWDSVAATLPQTEHDKKAQDPVQPARLAAFMSKALRKLNTVNSSTALLWINQTRTMVGMTFGDPTVAPGGRALPFYASHRVQLKKAGKITKEVTMREAGKNVKRKVATGVKIRASLEKSKLNAPHRETFFSFDFGLGEVDEDEFLASQGLTHGLISKSGAWYEIADYGFRAKGYQSLIGGINNERDIRAWLISKISESHGV